MSGAVSYDTSGLHDDDDGGMVAVIPDGQQREDRPANSPFGRQPAQQPPDAGDEYQMVDAEDDQGNGSREDALDTDAAGGGTYLDRQRAARDHAQERRDLPPEERGRWRQNQRARRREARDRNIAENAALRAEVEQLRAQIEGTQSGVTELTQHRIAETRAALERQIAEQDARITAARRALVNALQTGEAEAAEAAMDQQQAATEEKARLTQQKAGFDQRYGEGGTVRGGDNGPGIQQPQLRQQQPAQLSPPAIANMTEFFSAYPWLRSLTGAPLHAVRAMDSAVANMGFRPEEPEYWDTLDEMLRRSPLLRDKFDDEPAAPRRNGDDRAGAPRGAERRGPAVTGSGAAGQNANRRSTQVYITPERRDALERAGVLSRDGSVQDKARLQRLLRQYAEYDQQNGRPGRAGAAR